MDDTKQQLREDFITELMVFSPKYNVVTSVALADQMSEDELEQFVQRLQRINDREEELLSDLEEKDPSEYERKVREREAREEKVDQEFFDFLEQQMLKATDDVDKAATEIEEKIDKDVEQAKQAISEEYERTTDLLKAFYADVDTAEQVQKTEEKVEQPIRSVEEVEKELQTISGQTDSSKISDTS